MARYIRKRARTLPRHQKTSTRADVDQVRGVQIGVLDETREQPFSDRSR